MKGRQKRIRERKARQASAVANRYYLTPKVWQRPCSHCSAASSIAYRLSGRKTACVDCIDRLGIKARESQAWRDGGARAGSKVTVRHVDPESLRSSPLPAVITAVAPAETPLSHIVPAKGHRGSPSASASPERSWSPLCGLPPVLRRLRLRWRDR